MFSRFKWLSRIFQVGYILRYNDSQIHSIPVGITTLSNTMYKQINTQAGKNTSDSQPIRTYSKIFQPLKPRRNNMCKSIGFLSRFLIGAGVFIIFIGFPVNIVKSRQVKSQIFDMVVFIWNFCLVFLGVPNVFWYFCKAHTN